MSIDKTLNTETDDNGALLKYVEMLIHNVDHGCSLIKFCIIRLNLIKDEPSPRLVNLYEIDSLI